MSNAMCYIHPNTVATTTCDNCYKPICAADHRRYDGGNLLNKKLLCPNCLETAKSKNKIGNIIGIIAIIIIFGLAIGLVLYASGII